ncbi:single-stranded DNA-binding protein [Allobranchiibius huperziae]|uniref:Single-stranded DNA-binding protein n=1 Tax=Allobranchiibius huperziae TaxID=1874116 RepID=A0A853DG52_9MICO|nr:single-stranded DNA-binding protein [Allobranchiibius huperziae]NYJ76516.1 single-stranded DNA-binding protein [Allobranchiibius huperziae]
MSYLIQTGNLTQTPELRQSKAGKAWTEARVIHNDYEQGTAGEWSETSSIPYTVRMFGRQAEQLVGAAEANGNIAIQFAGRYAVRDFARKDGSRGISYEVNADTWAVLPGQDVQLRKSAIQERPASAGAPSQDPEAEPPW